MAQVTKCAQCGTAAPVKKEDGTPPDETDWIDMGWHFASDGRLLCPACSP